MRKKIRDPRIIRLRDYINSSGMRVEEVAREVGVTAKTVHYWIAKPTCRISPLASKALDGFFSCETLCQKEGRANGLRKKMAALEAKIGATR